MKRTRRWSDNQRQFGPFTYSADRWKRYGFMFETGGWHDEDRDDGANARIYVRGCTLIVELPTLFRRGREYGAFLSEGSVHFRHGAQTFDSSTSRSTIWNVPWLNWRHVRTSIYGLQGEHVRTEAKGERWETWYAAQNACPSASFDFDDFDGERITAKTRIEEREWRLGTKWCKWLSIFRRANVRRSLDIDFSKETGPKKGSWKGGTVGHSIEMRTGELHEAAFRRYCAEHRMTFVGVAAPASKGPVPS